MTADRCFVFSDPDFYQTKDDINRLSFGFNERDMDLIKLDTETQQRIDDWMKDLDQFTYEQLIQRPGEHSWSLGQVGIHLWMSAKGFFFKNAERCLSKERTEQGKSKNVYGLLVFTLGMMPPVRIKMPDKVAVEPRQPESKAQLMEKLHEVKTMAAAYIARVPDSDPSHKTRHPFLGWLNTAEWVQLCGLHFDHHLAQKKRICRYFGWN